MRPKWKQQNLDLVHRRKHTFSPGGCEESAPLKPILGAQVPEEGQTAGPAAF